jgi:hypothetical protein
LEKSRFFVGRNVLLVLALSGCAAHPCREPRAPELDLTKKAASTAPTNAAAEELKKAAESTSSQPAAHVRVYKADGSRQCEKFKKAISLETMERELAGISVYAREKRSDGLMHIQICGSPTGMINLYEIDSGFLKQAEQRGFKRLEE